MACIQSFSIVSEIKPWCCAASELSYLLILGLPSCILILCIPHPVSGTKVRFLKLCLCPLAPNVKNSLRGGLDLYRQFWKLFPVNLAWKLKSVFGILCKNKDKKISNFVAYVGICDKWFWHGWYKFIIIIVLIGHDLDSLIFFETGLDCFSSANAFCFIIFLSATVDCFASPSFDGYCVHALISARKWSAWEIHMQTRNPSGVAS